MAQGPVVLADRIVGAAAQGFDAGLEFGAAEMAVARVERLQLAEGGGRVAAVDPGLGPAQAGQREIELVAFVLGQPDDKLVRLVDVAQVAGVGMQPAQQAQIDKLFG